MAEAKTQPTRASVSAYIDALPDARMREDCRQLVKLMKRVAGAPPVMWGTSIIGFNTYRYTYASGASGDWPVIGFAPRARDLTLYLMDGFEQRAQALARLGRHTHSKSCLYVKSLVDIDLGVLEEMLADSVRVMRARYPTIAAAGAANALSSPTRKAARKVAKPAASASAKKSTTTATKKVAKKAANEVTQPAPKKTTPTSATGRHATHKAASRTTSRARRD